MTSIFVGPSHIVHLKDRFLLLGVGIYSLTVDQKAKERRMQQRQKFVGLSLRLEHSIVSKTSSRFGLVKSGSGVLMSLYAFDDHVIEVHLHIPPSSALFF